MGYTPAEVGEMSFWEFAAVNRGWLRSNGAEDGPGQQAPTPAEHDASLANHPPTQSVRKRRG